MGVFQNDADGERGEPGTSTDRRAGISADRRGVLRALGGAGALSAVTGSASAASPNGSVAAETATDAATPAEAREYARQQGEVDPVWGFPALSEDTDPPTSPRVEVTLQIRPRDAPIPEFVFEPTGLYLERGDTVRFTYESPHHSVTAYHPGFGYARRVPDEVPPFSSPLLPQGGYWLYTFERPGVYDVHCAPHEIFGHAMRIVVGSPSGPGSDPLPDLCAGQAGTETTGTGTTTTTDTEGDEQEGSEPELSLPRVGAYSVLSDPALDPDAIVDDRRVSWDDLAPESKQLFVQVRGFPDC